MKIAKKVDNMPIHSHLSYGILSGYKDNSIVGNLCDYIYNSNIILANYFSYIRMKQGAMMRRSPLKNRSIPTSKGMRKYECNFKINI